MYILVKIVWVMLHVSPRYSKLCYSGTYSKLLLIGLILSIKQPGTILTLINVGECIMFSAGVLTNFWAADKFYQYVSEVSGWFMYLIYLTNGL